MPIQCAASSNGALAPAAAHTDTTDNHGAHRIGDTCDVCSSSHTTARARRASHEFYANHNEPDTLLARVYHKSRLPGRAARAYHRIA